MKIKAIATTITLIIIIAIGLISCNSQTTEQNAITSRLQAEAELKRAEADRARAAAEAAAKRERAETDRLQAEAEAYQRRTEATTLAEIERAAIRQAERNASHERIIETLPFLVLIIGVVAIGALAVVMLAGRQSRPAAMDPSVLYLLQRQNHQRLAELERATWHIIAMEQRRQLSTGASHQVTVHDVGGRATADKPPT